MGFTEEVERKISDAPLIFARDIRQMLTLEEIKESVGQLDVYKERLREELETIKNRFVFRAGFALVKLIHEKCAFAEIPGDKDFLLFTVTTGTVRQRQYPIKVHRDTMLSPENLEKHPEDVDQYAKLLTKQALTRGRIAATQERSFTRKARTLLEWQFDRNHTMEEARQRIIEMAFYMGWSAEDCDYLLLRTGMENLCVNSVEDQLFRFMLEVEDCNQFDISSLLEQYKQRKEKIVKHSGVGNASTKFANKTLKKIIQSDCDYNEKLEAYIEKLAKNQNVYERYSKTARKCLEKLLIRAAAGLGWNVENAPSQLSEAQQRVLVSALLSGAAASNQNLFASESKISFSPYFSNRITYPTIASNGELVRMRNLGDRFLDLLSGNEKIGKNDIIFAVFLDAVYNRPNPQDPVERFLLYKEACEKQLSMCGLGRFYIPHPVEYACAGALLTGVRQQETFFDVVLAYAPEAETSAATGNTAKWDDPIQRGALLKKIPEEYEALENRLSRMLEFFPPFDSSLTRKKEIPEAQRFTEELWKELTVIAKELYSIWKGIEFHGFKMQIENLSNVIKVTFNDEIVYLEHRMSDALYAYVHDPDDKKHTFLSSVEIPALEGKTTIYELAKGCALSDKTKKSLAQALDDEHHGIVDLIDFLEEEQYLNRRLRRKTVLWMISGMVLNLYGYRAIELQAKNSVINNWTKWVPVEEKYRFKLPVVNATASCILSVDHMNPNDVLLSLKEKYRRDTTTENNAEEQAAEDTTAETENSGEGTNTGKADSPETLEKQAECVMESDPLEEESELTEEIGAESDPLLVYLSNLPPELPDDKIEKLVESAANGNVCDREKLVSHQSRLVYSIAREICENADDILALIDAGNKALLHLVETEIANYNPAKKEFASFITPTLRKAIRKEATAMAEAQRKSALDSSPDSMLAYLEWIAPFKTLPQEQVIQLAEKAGNGDESAQEKLIQHNLKLVYALAKKRKRNGYETMELVSNGNMALSVLIKESGRRYDPAKGKFSTFISPVIIEAMRKAERGMESLDIPKSLISDKRKIQEFQMEYYSEHNEMPTVATIATHLGKKPSTVAEILKKDMSVTSLDKTLSLDGEETLGEMILDNRSDFEAREMAKATESEREENRQAVLAFISENKDLFTPRELEVIHLRFGLLMNDYPHTVRETAELLKISPTDVLITEHNAINKIRYPQKVKTRKKRGVNA